MPVSFGCDLEAAPMCEKRRLPQIVYTKRLVLGQVRRKLTTVEEILRPGRAEINLVHRAVATCREDRGLGVRGALERVVRPPVVVRSSALPSSTGLAFVPGEGGKDHRRIEVEAQGI